MTPHDGRALLSTMIQGSTVDLFQSWGIAVAPMQPTRQDSRHLGSRALMALIHFSSPSMDGTLGLLVPRSAFELAAQVPDKPFAGFDWVQESANQLLGRLKSKLMQFRITLTIGLPQLLTEQALQALVTRGLIGIYRFRTLRGEIAVTLSGRIDYSRLEYVGNVGAPVEGDALVF